MKKQYGYTRDDFFDSTICDAILAPFVSMVSITWCFSSVSSAMSLSFSSTVGLSDEPLESTEGSVSKQNPSSMFLLINNLKLNPNNLLSFDDRHCTAYSGKYSVDSSKLPVLLKLDSQLSVGKR